MTSLSSVHDFRKTTRGLAPSLACLWLLFAAAASVTAANGSSRDLGPHRASDQACPACHTPRHAGSTIPAWNHGFADGTYQLYVGGVIAPDEPGAASKVCLSCHDGTLASSVASERWRGPRSAGATMMPAMQVSSHGSGGHPVGFDYAAAQASGRSALADPTTRAVTIGSTRTRSGSLAQTMLTAGRVECTSCHDAHNTYTVGEHGLTKARLDTVCLSCHRM